MSKLTAHISCPVNEQDKLVPLLKTIKNSFKNISYWVKEYSYDNSWINKCDVFILLLPVNSFAYPTISLPSGSRKRVIS